MCTFLTKNYNPVWEKILRGSSIRKRLQWPLNKKYVSHSLSWFFLSDNIKKGYWTRKAFIIYLIVSDEELGILFCCCFWILAFLAFVLNRVNIAPTNATTTTIIITATNTGPAFDEDLTRSPMSISSLSRDAKKNI